MRSIRLRLRRFFRNSKARVLILVNTEAQDPNFIYFTRFMSGVFEYDFLVVKRNSIKLFTSGLEYDTAMAQKFPEMKVIKIATRTELVRKLHSEVKRKAVCLNYSFLPVSYYNFLKKEIKIGKDIDATRALTATRVVKEPDEIQDIVEAVKTVKYTMSMIMEFAKEGMTEKQLAAIFNNMMMEHGAQEPAFKTNVSFGRNSAFPHHFPDNTRLRKNNIVLIDAGAKCKNYCSDITRTFIFKPDKKSASYKRVIAMIDVVKKAQRSAMALMKEGTVGKEVHLAAEKTINEADRGIYNGRFTHGVSHSIGIEDHDSGLSISQVVLKRGMVFSCEPGIYLPGFGGVRIEDDVLITGNGHRVL